MNVIYTTVIMYGNSTEVNEEYNECDFSLQHSSHKSDDDFL